MTTLAWILIMLGTMLISSAVRGRAMNITEDIPDAFVALLSADPKGLQAVLTRKGDALNDSTNIGSDLGKAAATAITGLKVYELGNVKPHVAAVANSVGPKHGIKIAYGYSKVGSVANSDHPKGLAVDFMTNDKAQGDALAKDLEANAQAYGLSYIIWWGQINTLDGRGWRKYTGPRNHHDHVHVSWKPQAIGIDPVHKKG